MNPSAGYGVCVRVSHCCGVLGISHQVFSCLHVLQNSVTRAEAQRVQLILDLHTHLPYHLHTHTHANEHTTGRDIYAVIYDPVNQIINTLCFQLW